MGKRITTNKILPHHITLDMRFKKLCVNNFQRLHNFFHPYLPPLRYGKHRISRNIVRNNEKHFLTFKFKYYGTVKLSPTIHT